MNFQADNSSAFFPYLCMNKLLISREYHNSAIEINLALDTLSIPKIVLYKLDKYSYTIKWWKLDDWLNWDCYPGPIGSETVHNIFLTIGYFSMYDCKYVPIKKLTDRTSLHLAYACNKDVKNITICYQSMYETYLKLNSLDNHHETVFNTKKDLINFLSEFYKYIRTDECLYNFMLNLFRANHLIDETIPRIPI